MTSAMVVETSITITRTLYIQTFRLHDDKLYDRLRCLKVCQMKPQYYWIHFSVNWIDEIMSSEFREDQCRLLSYFITWINYMQLNFLKNNLTSLSAITNDLCLFSYSLKDEDKNGIIPLHLSLHYLYFQGCWGVWIYLAHLPCWVLWHHWPWPFSEILLSSEFLGPDLLIAPNGQEMRHSCCSVFRRPFLQTGRRERDCKPHRVWKMTVRFP